MHRTAAATLLLGVALLVPTAAMVHATIDGEGVTSDAVLDWRYSTDPQQHSWNVVGAKHLAAGQHTVRLVGRPIAGAFYAGCGSNLCVLVHPAQDVNALGLP